jgi:hypothetical protein
VALAEAGYGLVFTNDGPTTSGELTVSGGTGGASVAAGKIVIHGGETTVEFRNPFTEAVVTGGSQGNAGWFLLPPTVALSATDYSGKGIAFVEYRIGRGAWSRYAVPFEYAYEGETTLSFRSKDEDGNLEEDRTASFKVDTRDPVVTASTDKGSYSRSEPFAVHFSASDPVPGSGVAAVTAALDGAYVQDGQRVDLLWKALGTHTVVVDAQDVAGRTSSRTVTFEIVASAASLAAEIDALRRSGAVDSDGVANSLKVKIDDLDALVANGRYASALHRLRALEREVRAQSGRHLTAPAADLLLGDIAAIVAAIR